MSSRTDRTRTAALLVAAGGAVVALVAVTARVPGGDATAGTNGAPEAPAPAPSAEPGVERSAARASALRAVDAWPSDEGTRFVERYSRDPESLPWMVTALGRDEFELGPLSAAHRDTLVEALSRAPRERARAAILAGAGEPAAGLASTLGLLEELGGAEDIEPMVAMVLAREEPDRETLEAFEDALARILERDARGVYLLRELFREEHRALWVRLASAVGRSRQVAALEHLARLLEQDPDLDALLLAQMGRLGALADPLEEWDTCLAIRDFLADPRPVARREAAMALGKLGDGDSTAELIRLLDDPNDGVRKSVLWALGQVSGLDLGDDAARWRAWYHEELAWWNDEYPALVEVLRTGAPEEIGPVIGTLTLKRLFRNSMASDLTELLSHDAPEIRARACVALRELGSHVATVALVGALGDPEESVRAAAHQALTTITGLELPPDHQPWAEALGTD